MDLVRDDNPVAVISHAFWQERFGGDPAAIGRTIRINDTKLEVVGVAAPGFAGDTVGWPVGVWLPVSMQATIQPGRDLLSANANPMANWRWLGVIGRLKPGISRAQAQANVDVVFRQFLESQLDALPPAQLEAVPQDRRLRFFDQRVALSDAMRGGSTLRKDFTKPLVVLLALVGMLLLSSCANLANLSLARAARRQKEIAVRVAMGARSSRIFRQLLIESLLLSLGGGALGLVLAAWSDSLLLKLVTQNPTVIRTDARIFLFALGISMAVGILFGTAPALQAWKVDLNTVLKGVAKGFVRTKIPLGKLLVVVQVALSLPLLAIAGLFVHSLQKLAAVDLGYDPGPLLLVQADTARSRDAAVEQFHRQLAERIRVVPGIHAVSQSANGLFTGRETSYRITIEGYEPPPGQPMNPSFDHIGPGYFATVGISVLRGRDFAQTDGGGSQRVGLINQTMASTYFGDSDPVGRIITVNVTTGPGTSAPFPFVVVGVVADARYYSVREKPRPFYYVPLDNPVGDARTSFAATPLSIVRTTGNTASAVTATRAAIKELAPNSQPPDINTVNQQIGRTLGLDRALTGFSGFFGVLATILVSIGIYGIMAYAVARRTREIGIRIAVGAQGANVIGLIVRESLFLVTCGALIGIPASIGASRFVAAFLFGVTPVDSLVLVSATGLMLFIAAIAAYFPARAASRIDPMIALRAE
jgi:predicted permease